MKISIWSFLIVICLWSCENIKEEDSNNTNDTTALNSIIIDSTSFESKGIIVDGINIGLSYSADSGFTNQVQMGAKDLGNNYKDDGWVVETKGKTKWVDYCAPQFSCKDSLLTVPGNKLSVGVYKFRYVYSDITGLHRYFSSALTFTILEKK